MLLLLIPAALVAPFNLRTEAAPVATLDSEQRAAVLKLASIYKPEVIPGKALSLLTQAHKASLDDLSILQQLAQSQLFYNLVPEAEASYLTLEKKDPDNPDVKAALERLEALKQVPHF